jgi:alpha-L-fucosidase 2
LEGLLRDSTLPNLWDTHPPFQIDGNFGATAGMIEMLVQSQSGVIDILPALPKAWPRGSINGIRARGDATLSVSWDECGVSGIDVGTGHDGPLVLRSKLFENEYKVEVMRVELESAKKDGRVALEGRAGGWFSFVRPEPCVHQ